MHVLEVVKTYLALLSTLGLKLELEVKEHDGSFKRSSGLFGGRK